MQIKIRCTLVSFVLIGAFSINQNLVPSDVQTDPVSPQTLFADTEEIPWEPVEGVAGAKWKLIRTDSDTGAITAVVQFPAGAVEDPHHHSKGHMIYILDGAKVVENLTTKQEFEMVEGMYLYTPAGNVHRIRYLTQCTFLFVTDGPFDMLWDKETIQ
jgi:quercetin dioxygenase-like cupin family protein